jgi:hypothetical protein
VQYAGRGHPACSLHLNTYLIGHAGSTLNQSINADIVLNGVIDNLGDPTWSFGDQTAAADRQISAKFPCRSVLLEGNYHAPFAETSNGNGSMVLIGAVQGMSIRANDCGGGHSCKNIAIITTGTDATLWAARDISLERNTGWDYTGGAVRLVEKGCEHVWDAATRRGIQTQQGLMPWSCEVQLNTVSDTPALCSGTDIGYGVGDNRRRQRPYLCHIQPPENFAEDLESLWTANNVVALPGFSAPLLNATETRYDGRKVYRIEAPTNDDGQLAAAMVIAEIPLATTPSAAGKSLAFTVLARTATASFVSHDTRGWNETMPTLTLLVDRGDGVWLASNGGALSDWSGVQDANGAPPWMNGGWDVHSFPARIGWSGKARFALAVAARGQVEVTMAKVAQIGTR